MKLTTGTVIRLKSFAHVEPDGKMMGFSASPEETPESEREVFTCIMIGKEPMVLRPDQAQLYALNVKSQLNLLGWFSLDQLEADMRDNIGAVGTIFNKLLAERASHKR